MRLRSQGKRWRGAQAVITLACLAASTSVLPAQGRGPSSPQQSLTPAEPIPSSIGDGFTLSAVGDVIMSRPATSAADPGFEAVEKILQGTDAAFANLEDTLIDRSSFTGWPAAENGGDTLNGPTALAADLRKMGFNLMGHANNHDTDWGIAGMEATDRALDAAGIVHAGSGDNLAAARAPRYLETQQGRIALVAFTSTYTAMEPAGDPVGEVAGRPGVSVLRTTAYHLITPAQMDALRQAFPPGRGGRGAGAAAGAGGAGALASGTSGSARGPSSGQAGNALTLLGTHFRVGAPGDTAYEMNPQDLSQILKAIREGKEDSNFEVVYIHSHEPGNAVQVPADFTVALAHDAIDVGADEFVASGPHQLRGIEIYKNKPIFYSLGDFFFQEDPMELFGPDMMGSLDPRTTTDYEFQQAHLRAFNNELVYQSIIAVSRFTRGQVSEIRLYPVDLGLTLRHVDRGVPRLASPEVAQEVLARLQALSKPFGTEIAIENNVGVIRVPQ